LTADVLVVVRIEDDVYVLDDKCSHEDFSLAEGEVNATTREIECERHGSMFRLRMACPHHFPPRSPVAHYDVRNFDGE
jgi:3-phenylpropionate/trans-cinnamate dioxygenase ferredoxin subunit